MAFSKKPSPAVVFVVVILLMTQPTYSKKRKPHKLSLICKAKCNLHCLGRVLKHGHFSACVMGCYILMCEPRKKTLSDPSFHCGVGCVKSKCSNPGGGNRKVSKECITSCLNNCEAKFVEDVY